MIQTKPEVALLWHDGACKTLSLVMDERTAWEVYYAAQKHFGPHDSGHFEFFEAIKKAFDPVQEGGES